jgi:UDP-hydrolysing UDP-N-acetyl-D-glucosamine 2-epimerase
MIKIVSHTTIRSDFDLMQSVYRGLLASSRCHFKLFVAGAHLSPEYNTLRHVSSSLGESSICSALTLIESRSAYGQVKSAANYLHSFMDFLHQTPPNLVLIVGDREDALMTALAAAYMRIPSVHLFAGDHAADGHVDNPVRHAISKLANSHFVAHESHRKRLLAIGESDESIYVTGNPGLWKYFEVPLSNEYPRGLGLLPRQYVVIVFHPVADESDHYPDLLQVIVRAVNKLGLVAAVGLPNTDPRAASLNLEGDVVRYGSPDACDFVNMLRGAAALVGNSSLGIIESASVPINCVNVGVRQTGRLGNSNVFYASCDEVEIHRALEQAIHAPLPQANIFGDSSSTQRIVELLVRASPRLFKEKKFDPLGCELHSCGGRQE